MLISNSFLALAAVVPASATALETTSALDRASWVDGDGAGPLATTAVVGWRGQRAPYAAHDSGPSPHKNADVGALAPKQRRAEELGCPTECPVGSVMYCVGSPVGDSCGEDCCTSSNSDHPACKDFSGCVKKDGSCDGSSSCGKARAAEIENSCKGGHACWLLGTGTTVGVVKDSCVGDDSCNGLVSDGDHTDPVMHITQSCNNLGACKRMRYSVGSITKSCNGYQSCQYVAYYGSVGPITKSCNTVYACFRASYFDTGSIKSITKTCNNAVNTPCYILGDSNFSASGTFGHLTKFVHAETGAKHKRDSIGSIEDCHAECVNDNECNGIKWKEHTSTPCRFFGGEISENKCNGKNVCITV